MFGQFDVRALSNEDKKAQLEELRQQMLARRKFSARARRFIKSLVIMPSVRWKKCWDVGFLAFLMWVVFYIPYEVAFAPAHSWVLNFIDTLTEVAFFFDIVVTFFSAFYLDDGDLVTDLNAIVLDYARGWFLMDLAASFPYTVVFPDDRAFSLFRLLRVCKLERAERRAVRALDLGANAENKVKLAKLLFYMVMTAHVGACIWFYIAIIDGDVDNSWTFMYGVDSAPATTQYLASLYWATATLTTVGYGDISAHTDRERGLAMFMIVLGAAMFALGVGKMSALAQAMNEKERAMRSKQTMVNQFLKFRRIPGHLRDRVRDYYDYMSKHDSFTDEEMLLADMSPSLRRAVSLYLNQKILATVPVLQFGGHAFQSAVITKLKPTVCLAKEYIICRDEMVKHIYFLKTGSVGVLDGAGYTVRTLQEGSFFGELEILDRTRSLYSVRALSHCELLMLGRAELSEVLADFPQFEAVLRNVGSLREAYGENKSDKRKRNVGLVVMRNTARPETPPPSLGSWDKREAKTFQTTFRKIMENSRTLQAQSFKPQPKDLSRVRLPWYLEPLLERLAENAHDVWAVGRMDAGWTWGPHRDNQKKQHPELMPFALLGDGSKAYDLEGATQSVKLILHSRYAIQPLPDSSGTDTDSDDSDSGGSGGGGGGGDQITELAVSGEESEGGGGEGLASSPGSTGSSVTRTTSRHGTLPPLGDNPTPSGVAALASATGFAVPSVVIPGQMAGGPCPSATATATPTATAATAAAAATAGAANSSEENAGGTAAAASSSSAEPATADAAGVGEAKGDGDGAPVATGPRRRSWAKPRARVLATAVSGLGISPLLAGGVTAGGVAGGAAAAAAAAAVAPVKQRLVVYRDAYGQQCEYRPCPFDSSGVRLPAELKPLIEEISENSHNVWAKERMEGGWRWGHHRDDDAREHNLLLPYHFLTEPQKEGNRNPVAETVKMVLGLGYEIIRDDQLETDSEAEAAGAAAGGDTHRSRTPSSVVGASPSAAASGGFSRSPSVRSILARANSFRALSPVGSGVGSPRGVGGSVGAPPKPPTPVSQKFRRASLAVAAAVAYNKQQQRRQLQQQEAVRLSASVGANPSSAVLLPPGSAASAVEPAAAGDGLAATIRRPSTGAIGGSHPLPLQQGDASGGSGGGDVDVRLSRLETSMQRITELLEAAVETGALAPAPSSDGSGRALLRPKRRRRTSSLMRQSSSLV